MKAGWDKKKGTSKLDKTKARQAMERGLTPDSVLPVEEPEPILKPKIKVETPEPEPNPGPEVEIKQGQESKPEKEKEIKEDDFKEGLKQIKTREELLAYLESLEKTAVRSEKEGSIFFPAYINEVKKSLEGNYELDWKTMREKIREIMGNKETEEKKKISFEEFKEKYKDVLNVNLFDEKREKWIYIQDFDEKKGAWVRFGEGIKYLKPRHVPLDELDALLREYKNKEEKIKKDDSAEKAEEIKSVEKQMEEADRKVYKEYADKFYFKLSDEKKVNWGGYTAEQKVETLNIQTLVFLQKELSQNPKYKDRAEKLAKEIFEGK